MERDENAVISDADGTMGHDEGTVDADPEKTTLNTTTYCAFLQRAKRKT
jgi:hypothetical protein